MPAGGDGGDGRERRDGAGVEEGLRPPDGFRRLLRRRDVAHERRPHHRPGGAASVEEQRSGEQHPPRRGGRKDRRERRGGREERRHVARDPEVGQRPRRAAPCRSAHPQGQHRVADVEHRPDERHDGVRRAEVRREEDEHVLSKAHVACPVEQAEAPVAALRAAPLPGRQRAAEDVGGGRCRFHGIAEKNRRTVAAAIFARRSAWPGCSRGTARKAGPRPSAGRRTRSSRRAGRRRCRRPSRRCSPSPPGFRGRPCSQSRWPSWPRRRGRVPRSGTTPPRWRTPPRPGRTGMRPASMRFSSSFAFLLGSVVAEKGSAFG